MTRDPQPGGLEHPDRGAPPACGRKWSVNESAQSHDVGRLGPRSTLRPAAGRPQRCAACVGANAGQRRGAGRRRRRPWPAARPAEPQHPVGQRGHGRGQRGPPRQPAERVVAAGPAAPARTVWCSTSALYVAMSTPVGQSRAQPLQARHRSSASCDRGVRQAAGPAVPSSASWSTRGAAAGGVLLLAGGQVGRAHHAAGPRGARTCRRPVQRCTASPSEPPSCGEAQREASARCRGRRRAQVGVQRRRVDEDAGVEQVLGVEQRLDRGEQRERLRVVHQREQLRARPAVAVLAGQRPAVAAQRERRGVQERRGSRCAARRSLEREVDPHVHAAVAEVAVGHAVAGRARRAARRSRAGRRRAARAARRRPPSRSTPARPRLRAASPAPSSRIRQSAAASAGVGDHDRRSSAPAAPPRAARRPASAGSSPVSSTNSQPPPRGQLRDRVRRAARTRSTIRASRPSQATIGAGAASRAGTASAASAIDGVAEHDQQPVRTRRRPARRWPRGRAPSVPSVPTRNAVEVAARARAAGARASSRRPGGRTGRTRCGRAPGARRPARASAGRRRRSPVAAAAGREPSPVPNATSQAARRCRRCGRSPARASRRRCCRSSRRSCSGCAWTGPGRTAARAGRPPLQVGVHDAGLDDGGAAPRGRRERRG